MLSLRKDSRFAPLLNRLKSGAGFRAGKKSALKSSFIIEFQKLNNFCSAPKKYKNNISKKKRGGCPPPFLFLISLTYTTGDQVKVSSGYNPEVVTLNGSVSEPS